MDPEELIGRLDFAVLRPEATQTDLEHAVEGMRRYRFNALTVSGWLVEQAVARLDGSGLAVGSVAGFPLGTSTSAAKALEAAEAVRVGAAMVDVVLPIGRLKAADRGGVSAELAAIRREVDDAAVGRRVELRGILETGYLAAAEVELAVDALLGAGFDAVKTSTGFGPRGADADEVRRLVELVRGRALVKASGGIRTAADVVRMVEAGADIVGTGSAPAIAEELRGARDRGELQD